MKNNPTELVDDLKVIRTIHSNKARKFSYWNNFYLILTIIVAVIVTYIGFSGPENIATLFNGDESEIGKRVENIINLMTLSILLITILGPILRFEKKMNKNNGAVVRLTEFIADVEFNYLNDTNTSNVFKKDDLQLYSERYKSLINSLPPTKDKDYFKALKTIKRKKKIKKFIQSEDYDKKNKIERLWHILWL
jgi:hypothetical protein